MEIVGSNNIDFY